jgi:hypothetical protein
VLDCGGVAEEVVEGCELRHRFPGVSAPYRKVIKYSFGRSCVWTSFASH